MADVAERSLTFARALEEARTTAAAGLPDWLKEARRRAGDRFESRGLPTTRDEEWRHTSVSPIASATFGRAGSALPTRSAIETLAAPAGIECRLVVVNGRFAPELSTLDAVPDGVRVASLRDAWATALPAESIVRRSFDTAVTATAFADLNAALAEDGLYIEVQPRAVVAAPLHVLYVVTNDVPAVSAPRLVIAAGEGAEIFVLETFAGLTDTASLTTAVTHVEVGPAAHVRHVKVQRESAAAFHLASTFVRLDRSSVFTSCAVTLGGRIARNDIHAELAGEGAECTLNGVYVAGGDSLVDTHTTIDHAKPHCPSHEVYKGILGGRSHAVFNGKIIVREDAQKTDAKQTNKALLLTDDAQINTKPQLEIFADDVKCTHGAAIGQLDDDHMFYLRARGIGVAEARNMLIHAFAGEVIEGINIESVRSEVQRLIDDKLERV